MNYVTRWSTIFLLLLIPQFSRAGENVSAPDVKVGRFLNATSVELLLHQRKLTLSIGGQADEWTLMEVVQYRSGKNPSYAVLEDFGKVNGHMLFVGEKGVILGLPKTSEPTWSDHSTVFRGHSAADVKDSRTDLLANEILAKPGDPNYEEIAKVFPPIRKMSVYSFLGTPENADKIAFDYGGRTSNFDPAPYDPPITKIREDGHVKDGLVGGWLPILRFVYPQEDGKWTEMIAFAPFRVSNGNDHIQPVWYRVARVESGKLKWARYIDSYHPFPPRTDYDPKIFYRDLAALDAGWNRILASAMKIDIPDERVANMARFSLVREMMTRVKDFPHYGVVERNYDGSEHDGFPDTFTVDTSAMLAWGLIDIAGRYIDNYFGQFVRDDGSLLYRGPETGQYGRMLTVVAEYFNYGGDPELLLKRRSKIDGVTKLLLLLREKAKALPNSDPAYGMIAGWSEADASLDANPQRYMQPYFSNSTEAARGFRDLGSVWEKIGKEKRDPELTAWGERLVRESEELQNDIQTAISRSILQSEGRSVLPSIAGVKEPFHVVVPRDGTDPQFRSYRAYMEMMFSGLLTREQVKMIYEYRRDHHDLLLGVPTAYGYNTGEIAGFLSYGNGYGLIQHDMTREALLLMYSVMAHQYTRGTWTAPETRNVLDDRNAAPYCAPAQVVVPLMTRWMLVFEDPQTETLWLGKAVPRDWLDDGKTMSVSDAPTRWGRVGFSITSQWNAKQILARIQLPTSISATTKLRLRAPGNAPMKSVTLNGKPWSEFSAEEETITIPTGTSGKINVITQY
jgi:hypothetical protein